MTHGQTTLRLRSFLASVMVTVALIAVATTPVWTQIQQGEVVGTLYGGVNKYHGEFSDDMFAVSTGIGVSYAAMDRLLVEARFGLGEYRWKITDAKIRRFPGYFGQDAQVGDRYPGTLTTIEGDNESRVTTVDVLASWILVPDIAASPFVTVGVGLFNFAPSNSEEHSALPNNLARVYPRTVVSIPVGGGVRIPLSSAVGLMLRADHRFVFSPYLDDIRADRGNDALTTISLGLSYNFTAPAQSRELGQAELEVVREIHMAPSTPSCSRCGCAMARGCCCRHGHNGSQPEMRQEEPAAVPKAADSKPAPAAEPLPEPTPEPLPVPTPEPMPAPAADPVPTPTPEPTTPKKRKSFSKDIRFVVNTDEFDKTQPETEKNLQELLTYMQESCDELQVMIEGHASADGPPERNRELSTLRARKVQQWLIDQGVTPSKIRGAMGFGSSMPRVAEPSPAAVKSMAKDKLEAIRRQNRRIEIAVLKDCKVQ